MTTVTEFRLMFKPPGKPWYPWKEGKLYRTDAIWNGSSITAERIIHGLTVHAERKLTSGGKWRIDQRTVTYSPWTKVEKIGATS